MSDKEKLDAISITGYDHPEVEIDGEVIEPDENGNIVIEGDVKNNPQHPHRLLTKETLRRRNKESKKLIKKLMEERRQAALRGEHRGRD